MPLTIETPRLILRVPRLEDAAIVQPAKEEMWPTLQKWMAWATDDQLPESALEDFIRACIAKTAEKDFTLYGFCKETGDYILSSGLLLKSDDPSSYSTGYWVAVKYQGQGYATEAINACARCAFGEFGAKRFLMDYYIDNIASKHVINKLGFTHVDAPPRRLRNNYDGTLQDIHLYEITSVDSLPPLDVTWDYAP